MTDQVALTTRQLRGKKKGIVSLLVSDLVNRLVGLLVSYWLAGWLLCSLVVCTVGLLAGEWFGCLVVWLFGAFLVW